MHQVGNDVSIHAPTRGATVALKGAQASYQVSIHAPTRGATVIYFIGLSLGLFQSTRPRGARQRGYISETIYFSFNPRAHAGRDEYELDTTRVQLQFQSTRPRGARRKPPAALMDAALFQSTRPRGARLGQLNAALIVFGVSIHAPTRGATFSSTGCASRILFQSTRPRGARRALFCPHQNGFLVSIHAPTRGAT